ncbi:MAG: right-handed parallel beta-helix repeat-containing protein [Candidatus Eisenbacteria bacterium]|uniref:Right-handed parallel beta-helix repeat-containing protein n=1 Tax=Eiseniibacteriota bacterium TaxID=2212470 RepID=A0A948RV54_UNCEI|nr:right-handed parallel beta-helix repeat-containing protein [Candidatus Eisenbacteria bacterium]MBU2690032.1 right-handed parallel beta-helix repeat-containing protein [Candidatus Eisenbacteria bacterium]
MRRLYRVSFLSIIVGLLCHLPAQAAILQVHPTGAGQGNRPPQEGVISFTIGDNRSGDRPDDLQAAIDRAGDGDTLRIWPGRYLTRVTKFTEALCGNCQEHRTPVETSRGFTIRGKSLVLQGMDRDSTILVTRAGYGVLIIDSPSCRIESMTITGGKRNPDGKATDAGIVVRRSHVAIIDVAIRDNTSRIDSVVVGIGGIMGREGAEILVEHCLIENNGWDGIALYRGATALIRDNIIHAGRGAGIGITWDSAALILRNDISGFWKGIGSFGDSRVVVRNNAVHDNLGWGLVATGGSWMDASHNVIIRNGNCGFAL